MDHELAKNIPVGQLPDGDVKEPEVQKKKEEEKPKKK